jgi:hypothetical protein
VQRIKASTHVAGSIRIDSIGTHQLPTEIHMCNKNEQETMKNINEQIQHGQSSSTPTVVDSGISSFSLKHDPLPECGTLQDVAIPTSNKKSMPLDMQSFGGAVKVEEDRYMGKLMEYPLRRSPQCLLLKTHSRG